jgi:hypothetical protein
MKTPLEKILIEAAPVLYGHSSVNTTNPNITGIRCFTEDKFKKTKYQAYFNAVLILVVFGVFGLLVVLYSLIEMNSSSANENTAGKNLDRGIRAIS